MRILTRRRNIITAPDHTPPAKARNAAPDGLILLHKQPGQTSFDSLRALKRALGSGKAGHTGTLDKFAEGLLLVLTGRALKLSQWFTHCDKQYEGAICFGAETDTLDPEGALIATAPLPSRAALEQSLSLFLGEIQQAPPAYSAIHINGERASTLSRRGETPVMHKRPVTIYRLELRRWQPPFAHIFVHCSSGTYIRSLARDIALAAGSRAYLTALTRTRVAGFNLADAISDCSAPCSLIRPIDAGVFAALNIPCVEIDPETAQKVIQGKPLAPILENIPLSVLGHYGQKTGTCPVALFSNNTFIALIERNNNQWNYGYVYGNICA